MAEFAYAKALQALTAHASVDVDRLLAAACTPAWDPVVYLADFAREVLLPLTAQVPEEPVASSAAGGVFITGETAVTHRGGHVRVWVPVTEQTARIGVLAVSLPDPDPTREDLKQVELLGVFAGLVVAATMRVSDTPRIRRQGRPLSLPASIQWDMMPPWTIRVPHATAAGILEPAYDIAGDAFDYAVDEGVISFAVFDGMGHGIGTTLLTGLAVGTYRHARRAGASLPEIHVAIDHALSSHYDDMSFATGILGTLHTGTGRLEWTCAGHPPPLLLRGGRVTELSSNPTLPFGLDTGAPVLHGLDLKPDDVTLVYTDGVTEAHDINRELFGPDRLSTLLARHASEQQAEELLRSLVRAILDHQEGDLRDDATMLMLRWDGA